MMLDNQLDASFLGDLRKVCGHKPDASTNDPYFLRWSPTARFGTEASIHGDFSKASLYADRPVAMTHLQRCFHPALHGA